MTQTSNQDKKSLEDLHQQANECFILGDVTGARSIWQAILQVDPGDRVAASRLAKTAPEGATAPPASAAQSAPSVDEEPALVPTSLTGTDPDSESVPAKLMQPDEDGAFELDLELEVPEDSGIVEEMVPAFEAPEAKPRLEAPPCRHDPPVDSMAAVGVEDAAVSLGTPAPIEAPSPSPSPSPVSVEAPESPQASASLSPETETGPVTSSGLSTPESEGGEAAILVSRARQALAQGRLDEAIDLATRALVLSDGMVAAQRILEGARAQAGRRVSEVERALNEGISEHESGRPHAAIPLLEKVLELMPGHIEAEEYLTLARAAVQHGIETSGEESEEGAVTAIPLDFSGVDVPEEAPGTPADDGAADLDGMAFDAALAPPPPALDDMPPPPEIGATGVPLPPPTSISVPGSAVGPGASPRSARASSGSRSLPSARTMLVALVAVIAMAGGGWWAMRSMGGAQAAPEKPIPLPQPTSAGPDAAGAAAQAAPAAAGTEPEANEAPGPSGGAAVPKPAPAPRYTRQDVPGLVTRAEAALAGGRESEAVSLLRAAQAADPSNFRVIDRLDAAQKALETRRRAEEMLERGRSAFQEGMFEEALRLFYRVPDTQRPPTLDGWIAAGWYNLGVRAMQAGNPPEAIRYFSDAIAGSNQDPEAVRHREVARRYRTRPIDDAYRIYAANVGMRALPGR